MDGAKEEKKASSDPVTHNCTGLGDASFTVENRGEGWYLYAGDQRGPNPVNFCPCCGTKLGVNVS